jgi:putative PIN family toxin of toxin-antitoxin system
MLRAVLDTNVIIAALRSSSGASHALLMAADRGEFEPALSVPLLAEYEEVISRPSTGLSLPQYAIDSILNRLCQVAHRQRIHYLWRPHLPDPKDDMVFEVALASQSGHLVTFNAKDFTPAAQWGISIVTPAQFIKLLP